MTYEPKILASIAALLGSLFTLVNIAFAQGTAFTYQGRLNDGTNHATGNYDLTFAVFTDSNAVNQVGSSLTNMAMGITNGLFTVVLDFGPGIFNGSPIWLQIGVETNGGGGFTELTPLQPLTPAPYAIFSSSAGSAASANGVAAGSVTGAGIAGNSVVKSLNNLQDAVTLSPGANISITPNGNTLTIASSSGGGGGWSLTGNSGTTPGVNFLGTIDNQAFEIDVNGTRAFRFEPGSGFPNVVGGSGGSAGPGCVAATIAGGLGNSVTGFYATIGGGKTNSAVDDATVAGGVLNTASGSAATIGGGNENLAGGVAAFVGGGVINHATAPYTTVGGGAENSATLDYAGIGGGYGNQATAYGSYVGGGGFDGTLFRGNTAAGEASTVGGGLANSSGGYASTVGGGDFNTNTAQGGTIGGGEGNDIYGYDATIAGGSVNVAGANYASIGGGNVNIINLNGSFATISGGYGNVNNEYAGAIGGGASNQVNGNFATVPGGSFNIAGGLCSFAAGQNATANDNNSFLWCDGTRAGVSQGSNSFAALATGGVWFYTDRNSNAGAKLAPGATSWTTISDRNAKKNFQDVDTVGVLEKLAAIPIQRWNYKWEKDDDVPNIGPMAQDFIAAFYPGRDNKGISTLEFDGVELAAIQGLNEKLEDRSKKLETENAELKAQVGDLRSRLDNLQKAVAQLTAQSPRPLVGNSQP